MGALWPIVLRSLRARPLRSVLTGTAVALGVAVVLAVQVTVSGLDGEARAAAAARAGSSGLDVRSPADSGVTDAQVATLSHVPGVVGVEPLYEKRVTARASVQSPGIEATVVSVSAGATSGYRPVRLVSGRLPTHDARGEVAIDAALAAALPGPGAGHGPAVGDPVSLTTVTGPDVFHIVGITTGTTGGAAFSNSAVFVGDATLRSNFSLGLRAPLVALRLAPGATAESVARAVRAVLGGAVSTDDPRAGIAQPLDQLRPMLALLAALSLVIGAGVTANSVSLSVLERRREIGLLRAAGAGSGQVYRIFMVEGLLCAAGGAIVGIVLGVLLGVAFSGGGADGLTGSAPPGPAQLDARTVLFATVLGLLAALAGGTVPALGAARLSPLAAIRRAPNAGSEHAPAWVLWAAPVLLLAALPMVLSSRSGLVAAGAAVMLTGFAAALPVAAPMTASMLGAILSPLLREAPLAARHLTRRRNRTAVTAAGLMASVATAVAVGALTGGALNAGDRWIGGLLVGDVVVHSGVAQPAAIAETFASQHGVREVSPIRYFSAKVGGETTGFAAVDITFYARHAGLDFVAGDRTTALRSMTPGPAVLIPRTFATMRNVHVGDVVDAAAGTGAVHLHVAGIVDHSFPTANGREALLLAQPAAVTTFGDEAAGFNDLQIVADQDMLAPLQNTASRFGMQATSVATIRESARNALEQVIGLLQALGRIAVLIAMLAVVNTLLVTVRQSTRDLGLLRAVGMARAHALRLLLTEAGLLAGSGGALGILAGCALALPMLRVSAGSGFTPEFAFPVETAGVTLLTVMACAVLAALIPASRAAGGSIVATIRYE
jgi:putative ABC transport system permease protein